MSDNQQARMMPSGVLRACARRSSATLVGALALSLWSLAFAAPALAGPPTHPHKPALDLVGAAPDPGPTHPAQPFNRACGTAVDSEGDVYVASAGKDAIDVFNAAHEYLTTIANPNDPCALAVNSQGHLFVSETATGNVVRYKPTAYPFSGTPTYEPVEAIDSSGQAQGIAIDPFDDRLYVAKGDRIIVHKADGTPEPASNEVQRLRVSGSTGGTYTLTFRGQTTPALAFDATSDQVDAALEALSTIGAGNVAVTEEAISGEERRRHLVTFAGALQNKTVPQLHGDGSNLTGGGLGLHILTVTQGFSGHVGVGELSEATGVAAYTYKSNSFTSNDRYLFVADAAGDEVKIFSGPDVRQIEHRRMIAGVDHDEDPATPERSFGFGAAGAYLGVDPGNPLEDIDPEPEPSRVNWACTEPIDQQACTAGHFFLYDDAHKAIEVFEASGEHLTRIPSPEPPSQLEDGAPTAIAVDRSGGAKDGTIYVTSGAGPGARLLGFGPLTAPSRAPEPELSHVRADARAVATDRYGNVYEAAGHLVKVYGPDGEEIAVGPSGKGVPTETAAWDIAVDSACNLYTMFRTGGSGPRESEKVQYYAPAAAACPPQEGTQYGAAVTVADGNSFAGHPGFVTGIGIDPADDHLFFASLNAGIVELGSAAEGSPIVDPCFACSLGVSASLQEVEVHGATGNVYVSGQGTIWIVDPTGSEVLARIDGAGSPKGRIIGGGIVIAVDQANGHVLAFKPSLGAVREYDAAGGFVGEFGTFADAPRNSRLALDNSCALQEPPLSEATTPSCGEVHPSSGNLYLAYDDPALGTLDLWAFGPLSYGEAPLALTGAADGIEAGAATLHGTVNPRGFDLEGCRFEYLSDAAYLANGKTFAGALSAPCEESLTEIGKGTSPVAVHATLSGLLDGERYRYRLVAENKYGASEGKAGIFGPPLLAPRPARPVLYDEATLHATLDPSGLPTQYRFQYGLGGAFDRSTPLETLSGGDGAVAIEAALGGLAEGAEYRFRLVAENEAGTASGPVQSFLTLARAAEQSCANSEYRTGLSAALPDCRAYELVTPGETRGSSPSAYPGGGTPGEEFNNWLVAARGEGAGESIAYFATTLPGFQGTGQVDGYRAQRGAGDHPAGGWTNELFSPSYAQVGVDGSTAQQGIAADQRYGLFEVGGASEAIEGTLPAGQYLRTPSGFEPVARGSGGTDLAGEGRFVSAGGAQVVFFSSQHLEPKAAPAGTTAIYRRAAGASSAEVVSVKPDGSSFGAGEHAQIVATSEDGAGVLFRVDGTLYLQRAGQSASIEIAASPNAFAGISEDGKRVFYAAGSGSAPSDLFLCDVAAGPCVGGEPSGLSEIAEDAIFANVSADGSRVYFTSEEVLTGAEANEGGETAQADDPNLYSWDGTDTSFVAVLDPQDLTSFGEDPAAPGAGDTRMNFRSWSSGLSAGVAIGRANSPTRSTPGGEVLVFQSHAQLTAYDNEGKGEIYRYEPGADPGGRLLCVSCDPTGAPPSADAMLQINSFGGVVRPNTLIPNVTDDGEAVFFQSADRLLPGDANRVRDVYQWKAPGEGCSRPGGCLALISSGQGEEHSYLYGMSADGRDVFFWTRESLVGADVPGSPSIYDARVGGGIPDPPAPEPCQGDACQGQGSPATPLPAPASTAPGPGTKEAKPKRRCPKGKHRVVRRAKAGPGKVRRAKVRCVKARKKKGQAKRGRRADHNRGARR